jgi:hypothetical protein
MPRVMMHEQLHTPTRQDWHSIKLVVIVTFFVMLILCGLVLLNAAGNARIFTAMGTLFTERDPNGTKGYDGQFAYYIARDGAQAILLIDAPTLRFQRILYPILSRVLALGSAELVPWTLLFINLAAHIAAAGLLAYLLVTYNAAPFSALIYSVWIGNIFAVRFDLNEPLCFALILGALVAYRHKRYLLTVIVLMLATITRETALVIAAALALHSFTHHRRRWAPLIFGGPALLFAVWWGIMRLWLGNFPTEYIGFTFLPFQGMMMETEPLELLMLTLWLVIPTVILAVLALRQLVTYRRRSLSIWLMLAAAAFVMYIPGFSWVDPLAAYRVATPLVFAGLLFVGQFYPRRWLWLGGLWLPTLLLALIVPNMWIAGS